VICGKPYYPQWSGYEAYRGGGWRRTREQGVHITRCPHYVPAQPSGVKRIIHLASFAASALRPVAALVARPRARRPQLVLCVAPAIMSLVPAWIAARLSGAKLWVHVQDFEMEAAFATGLVDSASRTARLARLIEGRLLGLADIASSISPQMCAKLVEKGFRPDQVIEIRNWSDASCSFTPPQASPYRAQWAVGDRHVALYSGNIANKQGIEVLVEAARLLQHRRDILFVICGQGPNRAPLEALAAGLDNIQFHDLQPSERMGELLSLASVHLLPQIPGAADLVLPSKLTNMLASGRAVVATAEPGTGLYDEVDGCGTVTTPGKADEIAAALSTLIDDPQARESYGRAGAARAVERWSMARIIDRLEGFAQKLCDTTAAGGQG